MFYKCLLQFRTDVLPSWISHLYRKHNTTPDLVSGLPHFIKINQNAIIKFI